MEACELTGSTPIKEEEPVDESELTDDLITVFNIYRHLASKFDSMSGVYTGKDFGNLEHLFSMHEIPKGLQLIYMEYLTILDEDNVTYYANKKSKNGKGHSSTNP